MIETQLRRLADPCAATDLDQHQTAARRLHRIAMRPQPCSQIAPPFRLRQIAGKERLQGGEKAFVGVVRPLRELPIHLALQQLPDDMPYGDVPRAGDTLRAGQQLAGQLQCDRFHLHGPILHAAWLNLR